jgi:hypothetical protein
MVPFDTQEKFEKVNQTGCHLVLEHHARGYLAALWAVENGWNFVAGTPSGFMGASSRPANLRIPRSPRPALGEAPTMARVERAAAVLSGIFFLAPEARNRDSSR